MGTLGRVSVIVPSKIFDLSQPVFANCPQYEDRYPRPVVVSTLSTVALQGVNKEEVHLTTHTGTHCDAPYHFFDAAPPIDQVALETFVAPAVIVDLRSKKPGSYVSSLDLRPIETHVQPGDVVLLNTGWGHKRALTKEFLSEWPYLSGEAAEFLLSLNVKGVGIDAVSLGGYDDPRKAGPAHMTLLGAGRFIVEELCFPDEVMDGRRRLFCAAPVKLRGCSGAWTRAMLWEFGREADAS